MLSETIAELERLEAKAEDSATAYVDFLVAIRTNARALLTAAKLSEKLKEHVKEMAAQRDACNLDKLLAALAAAEKTLKEIK